LGWYVGTKRTDAGNDCDIDKAGFVFDQFTLVAVERVEIIEVDS
jgi:hypothetical protein